MLIQVVVRLILYTDQFVSRKDQTTGSEGTSQEETRGIDNTVGTIHILRKQDFGTFSDPPIHPLCMYDLCTDSKQKLPFSEDHLSEPTYLPVHSLLT